MLSSHPCSPRTPAWPHPVRYWLHALLSGCVTITSAAADPNREPEDVAATAGAEPAAYNVTVRLPPFVVSVMRTDKHPWQHAAVPGFEILSRASRRDTYWFLDALHRGRWLEEQVLPESWRPPPPLPYAIIIDNTDLKASRRDEMPADPMTFAPPTDAFLWGKQEQSPSTWSEPIAARDSDTYAMGVNLRDVDMRAPAYAWVGIERLLRCTPPLPAWLMTGLLDKNVGLLRGGFIPVRDPPALKRGGKRNDVLGLSVGDSNVTKALGPGTLWISAEETKRLRAAFDEAERRRKMAVKLGEEDAAPPPIPITFLPLHQIFREAPPADGDVALWKSEAALFVRWGLVGPGRADPALAKAFVLFGERARREPVTEQVFVECFGFGYREMQKQLDAFLREVLAEPVILSLESPPPLSRPKLVPATADQIGRMLGDWMRLQAASVRDRDPGMSGQLMYAAGAMLFRAYQIDNGLPPDAEPRSRESIERPSEATAKDRAVVLAPLKVSATRIRDADLLAVYGLYEHDSGNLAEARALLEQARRWEANRPRAALVLAQLRYADARANPAGAGGKLSEQQAAFALEPLRSAWGSAADAEICALMLHAWSECDAQPPAGDLDRIVEGARRYPRETPLAARAASLLASAGDVVRARSLLDQALAFETDAAYREELLRHRAALEQ